MLKQITQKVRIQYFGCSDPVQCLLKCDVLGPAAPNSAAADLATFTNEEISFKNFEPFALCVSEFHRQQVIRVDAPPLNVDIAKILNPRFSRISALVQHLSKCRISDLA